MACAGAASHASACITLASLSMRHGGRAVKLGTELTLDTVVSKFCAASCSVLAGMQTLQCCNLCCLSWLLQQSESAVTLQMMTPFQLANIVVQTYPWVPDTGALLNILAAQEGRPSAIQLLGFAESEAAGPVAAASALHSHAK